MENVPGRVLKKLMRKMMFWKLKLASSDKRLNAMSESKMLS
jgi:hypothetical protein